MSFRGRTAKLAASGDPAYQWFLDPRAQSSNAIWQSILANPSQNLTPEQLAIINPAFASNGLFSPLAGDQSAGVGEFIGNDQGGFAFKPTNDPAGRDNTYYYDKNGKFYFAGNGHDNDKQVAKGLAEWAAGALALYGGAAALAGSGGAGAAGAAGEGAAGSAAAGEAGAAGATGAAGAGEAGLGGTTFGAASGAAPTLTGTAFFGEPMVMAGAPTLGGATGALAGYGGLGAGLTYGAAGMGLDSALSTFAANTAASSSLPNMPPPAGPPGGNSPSTPNAPANGFDWTKLIGPGLSAASGVYAAGQAKDAANAQLQATREAQAKLEPWYQAGGSALNRLQELLGIGGNRNAADFGKEARDFGAADFQTDPGYQFRLDQGQKALERSASRIGGIGSGKFLKDAMDYNQGQASSEYNNAFNRFYTARQNKLNPLQSLAGQGQSTAAQIGDLSTQGGNAIAAGKVGSANAITNALGQGYSMYQNQQQMDQNNSLMNLLLRR